MLLSRLKKKSRQNIRNVGSFEVKSSDGNNIRLDNLLEFKEISEAKELNRYNKMRSITLSAGLNKKLFVRRSDKIFRRHFNKKS